MMDLFIQTLTGTLFELRVSPFETILSIKGKIQRLEGIPISQQHLIWKSVDLKDDCCFHDYGIQNGAKLTLVLAMRDGPINMRRVSIEEPEFQEIEEYMEANRDEIWDKLLNDEKQVTLLVFRDGDQFNFFRVYDRVDGSLTPYPDSLSTTSLYNQPIDEESVQKSLKKQNENALTKDKMTALKERMAAKYEKSKKPRPPSTGRPSSKLSSQRRVGSIKTGSGCLVSRNKSRQKPRSGSIPAEDRVRNVSTAQYMKSSEEDSSKNTRSFLPSPPCSLLLANNEDVEGVTPPLISPSTYSENNKKSSVLSCADNEQFYVGNQSSIGRSSSCSSCKQRKKLPAGLQDISERVSRIKSREQTAGDRDNCNGVHTSGRSRRHVLKPLNSSVHNSHNSSIGNNNVMTEKRLEASLNTSLRKFENAIKENYQLPDILNTSSSGLGNYKPLLNWAPKPKSPGKSNDLMRPISKARKKTPEMLSSKLRAVNVSGNNHLPPVHNEKRFPPTLTGKKRIRCLICTKKLGLATTYQCRCGGKFCAAHRYPETHTCTYDYKTEGRKFLQKSNPVVTAPKLPKI